MRIPSGSVLNGDNFLRLEKPDDKQLRQNNFKEKTEKLRERERREKKREREREREREKRDEGERARREKEREIQRASAISLLAIES
ncbi:hypothetical protein DPMN_057643 [Dreissena polymorpha]|uniref:Uncharacterized protein n=1 Tax=Dreissena polymorpha TaxID=45954 RepID=A0A9D4C0J6_DREPO|nr:hypothetical protein DPMN_057643 [Dreissena polymorpha]